VTVPESTIEVAADSDGIVALADWAEARAAAFGLDADARMGVRLCVEEAATNVVVHGLDGSRGQSRIALVCAPEPGGLRFVLIDDGKPFDPTSAPDLGYAADLESAAIGGRGIRLMRKFARTMRYARTEGRNRLTLAF
jgi:serine/threonine-protein kinase RsbW